MYQFSYAESIENCPKDCRDRERRALEHAIALLQQAEVAGAKSMIAGEAVFFLAKLWRVLIDDLIDPENDLPDVLRADLVSVGLWVLRETELIRAGRSESFRALIEICGMIRDGLK